MADGESGKAGYLLGSQQNVPPFDEEPDPPGYTPYHYSEQPGPVTVQPGVEQPFGYHSSNTTVVVQQQQVLTRPQMSWDWNSGLCGCFEDMTSCCAVFWCMPCYTCYLSNKLGESCCLPLAIGSHSLIPLRTKVRVENNII
ncbi:cornifelin homolog B-like, partial [Saccostrea cucullata]|uniref:cornifelin homolog B-like n=1 Tax=Saccostrea cuccullata TaxID=36930 RepID=UPI002ED09BDD